MKELHLVESLNETLSGLKVKKKLDILKELKKDPNYKEDPRWKQFEDELINVYRVDPSEADIDTALYYTEFDWIDANLAMESLNEDYDYETLEDYVRHYMGDDEISLEEIWEDVFGNEHDEDLANDVVAEIEAYRQNPYDADHAEEWVERNHYGYYNNEDDYGVNESLDEAVKPFVDDKVLGLINKYEHYRLPAEYKAVYVDSATRVDQLGTSSGHDPHDVIKAQITYDTPWGEEYAEKTYRVYDDGKVEEVNESLNEASGKKYKVTGTLRNIWYDDDGNEVDREEWKETHTYTINSDNLPPEDLAKIKFEDGVTKYWNKRVRHDDGSEFEVEVTSVEPLNESLTEDTVKQNGKWVNKGKEGTHGKFKTKKAADDQRKAMFRNGYKGESLDEGFVGVKGPVTTKYDDKFNLSPKQERIAADIIGACWAIDPYADMYQFTDYTPEMEEFFDGNEPLLDELVKYYVMQGKEKEFLRDIFDIDSQIEEVESWEDPDEESTIEFLKEVKQKYLGGEQDTVMTEANNVAESLDEDMNDIYYVVQFDNNDFMKIYPGVKGIYHSPLNGATLFDSKEQANGVCERKQDSIRKERLTPHIVKVRSLGVDKNEIVKESLDEAKNDTLNPAIWEDEELKPEVKEKLQFIADTFIKKLKEDDIPLDVDDIVIVGSNRNYNYGPQSDIDLHIIADLSQFKGREKELAEKIYQRKKSIFNDKYDPTINGFEVEIYVEPAEDKNDNEIPDEVEVPTEEPLEEQLRKPSKEEVKEMLDMINEFDEEISGFELGDFARKFNLENVEAAEKVIDCIKGGSDTLDNGEPWWSLIRDDTEDDLLFPDEDMEEVAFCPNCDGEQLNFLGYQGNVEEFKCPICGGYFYRKPGSDELTSEWEVEVYND